MNNLKILLLLFLLFILHPIHSSLGDNISQHEVEAAFIYNFIKFVEWPQDSHLSNDGITICVFGEGKTGKAINVLQSSDYETKGVLLRKVNSVENIDNCHILYINPSKKQSFNEIINNLEGKHILTISHEDGFAKKGGIINFFIENERINFEINLKAANEAKLKISSRLLNLAKIVD